MAAVVDVVYDVATVLETAYIVTALIDAIYASASVENASNAAAVFNPPASAVNAVDAVVVAVHQPFFCCFC